MTESLAHRRGSQPRRDAAHLALIALVLAAAVASSPRDAASAASGSTTVSAQVQSATNLGTTGCQSGTTGSTSLGSIAIGGMAISTGDCVLAWGSSNDTATLRASQSDRLGVAMFLAAHGALDTGYGASGTGLVTVDFEGRQDNAWAAALQPDGKVVLVGDSGVGTAADFALARLTVEGTLDPTFGGSGTGRVRTDFGAQDEAYAGVSLDDGRILAAGSAGSDIAVARYLADGSPDTTFGAGTGRVRTDLGGIETAWSLLVQPSGRVIVAGSATGPSGSRDFALLRYTQAGALDSTFGAAGTGVVHLDFGGSDAAMSVVAQPDGKLVVAGDARDAAGNGDFGLARFSADGVPDPTFGSGGVVRTDAGGARDNANAAVLQPDGKIIVIGTTQRGSEDDLALARYQSDGTLDTSFGAAGTGIVVTDFGAGDDSGWAGAVQRDGKLLAYVDSYNGSDPDMALARYDVDGRLDRSFGAREDGLLRVDFSNGTDIGPYSHGLVIEPDGRVLVAGYSTTVANEDFGVFQLASTPVPDYAGDWSAMASGFGACLHGASAGVLASWPLAGAGNCTGGQAANWRPIRRTADLTGASVASTTAAGSATVSLRFGFKAGPTQRAGSYVAPLTFDVIAPSA